MVEAWSLDNMDDPCLKHYMKLWADKWNCKGETKGGYTQFFHKKIIITSNYTNNELFKDSDDDMVAAIKRRLNAPFLVTIRSTEIQSDHWILLHMGCGTSVVFCRMMTCWELS